MSQKEDIINLADKYGLDTTDGSSQADSLRKIAENLGMDHYDSLSNKDTEELLRRMKEYDQKKFLEKTREVDEENSKKKKTILRYFLSSLGCLIPVILMLLVLFIAIIVALGLLKSDGSVSEDCIDVENVDEVCTTITVTDHGTMSVDEYVAGVVQHEFGGAPDETLKAQAIAARSYGIAGSKKNGNGNCSVGRPSEGFQTYSDDPSDKAIQAANDTSGMVMVTENGSVARTEYSSNSLPNAYDSYGDTITMSERNLKIPRNWFSANKTCSDSALNSYNINDGRVEKDAYGREVYGCGHGRGMGQIAAKYLDNEKGYTYEQILEFFYGKDSEYKWSLASSSGSGRQCRSSNNGTLQPLKNYKTNHDGLKVLSHTLSKSERESLDDYLNKQISAAGYGTGAGVAAAGQSLVYWLEQNGLYLQYFWGGGQGAGDREVVGASPNWGSTSYGADPKGHGNYFGMDCSGFVSWAVRTACAPNSGARMAHEWKPFGPEISLNKAKPGDVIANDGHVMLVVKNNGDGTVYVAEESDNLGFTLVGASRASGRKVVDMTQWYKDHCDKKKGA